jgi:hypothetical protein
MTTGGSIALIVIGAILKFAINWSPALVNLALVGVILMIAGVLGLVISLTFMATRRRRLAAGPGEAEIYEERRYTEPPV